MQRNYVKNGEGLKELGRTPAVQILGEPCLLRGCGGVSRDIIRVGCHFGFGHFDLAVTTNHRRCFVMLEVLLNKQDAADRLKVSQRTIDRLRASELLKWVPVGRQVRFREADLASFILKQAQGA